MNVHFLRGCSATALCVFLAQPALADLTAQDVWNDWRDYLASTGYEVTGTEAVSGTTLTVSDITMTLPIPEEDVTVSVVLPSITLIGNSDGSVNVEFPSPMPIRISGSDGSGDGATGEVVMTHSGSVMNIAGDPQNMTYTHSSAETTFALGEIVAEGKTVPPEVARLAVTLVNSQGVTKMTLGDLRSFDQTYSAASLTYDMAFDDPDSDDNGSFKGALQGLSFDGTGAIPKQMDPSNMAAMLKAGFAIDGGFSFSGGNSNVQGIGDGQQFGMSSTSQGGSFRFGMNVNQLSYDAKSMGNAIEVTTAALPFPVAISMAEAGFKLVMPVSKSDEPQDIALGMTVANFTMSDMIWGLFDPAGNLPRDPATIIVDLSGKAKLFLDIMDPASAEAMANSPVPPGELHAVTIGKLLVSAVGAQLSGAGAFTFDNSDMQTIPGMPRPEGAVDLQVNGANGLMDNLIKMGILSDQDAMPARMMMGMFTVPGDGPDSLKSRIEINAQGHILANGQRIK